MTTSEFKRTMFKCNKCNKTHVVEIPLKLLDAQFFPISYAYIHGSPEVIAILYIDKEGTVRGVEYPKGVGIKNSYLTEKLNIARANSLSPIPESKIYAFKLLRDQKIEKIYFQENYKELINFPISSNIKFLTMKTQNNIEYPDEFYLKYSEFWVLGLKFFEYDFIIIVDSTIDIEHLKTQAMVIFESFKE